MNRVKSTMLAGAVLLASGAMAGSALAAGPQMDLVLDGLGGNPTTSLMWSAKLGKYKNGQQVGDRTPYSIYSCKITATKSFRVKDTGSKFRSYAIPLAQVDELNAKLAGMEYTAHTGNGNTEGVKQLLSRNSGKTRFLEEDLASNLGAAYVACETESAEEGWTTGGTTCVASEGITFTGKCNYAEFPDGVGGPSKKVSATYTYDDSAIAIN